MTPEAEQLDFPRPHGEGALRKVEDPLPDPEPAVPSLTEPDPGVFHHEPAVAPAPAQQGQK